MKIIVINNFVIICITVNYSNSLNVNVNIRLFFNEICFFSRFNLKARYTISFLNHYHSFLYKCFQSINDE